MTIQTLARDLLDPALKPLGFDRKGLAWNRKRGAFVDVIALEKAKTGNEQGERLSVNIALAVPEFHDAMHGKIKTRYSEAHSLVRLRPGGSDGPGAAGERWYDLRGTNEAAARVQEFILERGVPFLEGFEDFRAVALYLDGLTGWPARYPYIQIGRALVHWKLGNLERCEALLSQPPASQWPQEVARARSWMQQPVNMDAQNASANDEA
jgi:hypothetical protein